MCFIVHIQSYHVDVYLYANKHILLVPCTCAAVEVYEHRDTPTQRLRILCTVLAVYTINYYFTGVEDMCLILYRQKYYVAVYLYVNIRGNYAITQKVATFTISRNDLQY